MSKLPQLSNHQQGILRLWNSLPKGDADFFKRAEKECKSTVSLDAAGSFVSDGMQYAQQLTLSKDLKIIWGVGVVGADLSDLSTCARVIKPSVKKISLSEGEVVDINVDDWVLDLFHCEGFIGALINLISYGSFSSKDGKGEWRNRLGRKVPGFFTSDPEKRSLIVQVTS